MEWINPCWKLCNTIPLNKFTCICIWQCLYFWLLAWVLEARRLKFTINTKNAPFCEIIRYTFVHLILNWVLGLKCYKSLISYISSYKHMLSVKIGHWSAADRWLRLMLVAFNISVAGTKILTKVAPWPRFRICHSETFVGRLSWRTQPSIINTSAASALACLKQTWTKGYAVTYNGNNPACYCIVYLRHG